MTATVPTHTCWSEVLAELEAQLDRFDTAVVGPDAQVLDLPAWAPPSGLGPIPVDLVPRAEQVLIRLHRAADTAGAHLDRLRGEQGRLGQRRRASNAYARAAQ
jgi:hypothetical protein